MCMCANTNPFVFVYVCPDTGHALIAWLIVMKSRPAQVRQMRKTPLSSQMILLEQKGKCVGFFFILTEDMFNRIKNGFAAQRL